MLYLDFYHHIILVRCNESTLIQKLREEFHFFVLNGISEAKTVIELHKAAPPQVPSTVAVKILENCAVYRLGPKKYVDYFGEALTVQDLSSGHINIYSEDLSRLYELSFLAVHSVLGQELDKGGLSRLHALAVAIRNINAVVMLPSKGGKSTLLKNVLKNPEVKIISDDMPLCDTRGKIYPFPSKISLSEIPESGPLAELTWHEFKRHHFPAKWTASLSQMDDRLARNPEENATLLIAGFRLSSGTSILTEVPRWKMIMPLMEHMIVGMGLPQIIELFLNFQIFDLFKMVHHAFLRSICAFNLARRARCYYFYMGPDKSYNAQLLLDLIYEHQAS